MSADFHASHKQLIFNINKIKSKTQLRSALLHNKRQIESEMGPAGHIDPARMHLNYPLVGAGHSSLLWGEVEKALADHREHTKRQIRHDAVMAVEILFSVSAANTGINLAPYFEDCVNWSINEFAPAQVLSAEVHFDEANPHMHVIFLCVTKTKLVASSVVGYTKKYRERLESFFLEVGKKHGLELPPPRLSRSSLRAMASQAIEKIEQSKDPITLSAHYPAIVEAIKRNPAPFARTLSIGLRSKPSKRRTVVEIFTSKGKGSNIPER